MCDIGVHYQVQEAVLNDKKSEWTSQWFVKCKYSAWTQSTLSVLYYTN